MDGKRIMFVGLGELGSQIFDLLVRLPGRHTFLVGGRNEAYLRERCNLALFAAMQLGYEPDIRLTFLDLMNVEQTAQTISLFRPDLIFCAATMQRWGVIFALPRPLADRLYEAQMGPWLPLHLSLVYRLMQAVQHSGLSVPVINATYPDVVNAVLNKVQLAPTTGIGDLANNIPALRLSVALKLHIPVQSVNVRFFTQRYLSYRMSRLGNTGGAPFHLTAYTEGEDVTSMLDKESLFDLLPHTLKRASGHVMTAASAMVVCEGMVHNTGVITHAPGPNGLPGGYPVRVHEGGVEVMLPEKLTMEQAIQINEQCMRFDGIEQIAADGTVYFTESHMAIFKDILGYACKKMPLAEVDAWAEELKQRYQTLLSHTTQ